MKYYFKIVVIFLLRILLQAFFVFPIRKNQILFVVHEGARYDCNPKYIFEHMHARFGNSYHYVWCLNDANKLPADFCATCVKFLSPRYLYYLFTSGTVVTNLYIEPFFTKRKGQLVINTWHGGGAYKNNTHISFLPKSRLAYMAYIRRLRHGQTDHMLSSCRAFIDTHHSFANIESERFLPVGTPRNDLFFRPDYGEFRLKLCESLGIETEKLIVLYAPTYRGLWRGAASPQVPLDADTVGKAVSMKFGGEVAVLVREHPLLANSGRSSATGKTLDVSRYPFMQELLSAVDVFITEYSSSMWDYSFTFKPGFLFTPDLEEYKATTDLFTPIEQWPFPYAKTVDELCAAIAAYDAERAAERIRTHHALLGSYEKGTATETVCRLIQEHQKQHS